MSNIIKIDRDLEDIVPGFLSNLEENIQKMELMLEKPEFEKIRVIGHNMKGSGGGYGFDFVTELGAKIENSALSEDQKAIANSLESLTDYLKNIKIMYH